MVEKMQTSGQPHCSEMPTYGARASVISIQTVKKQLPRRETESILRRTVIRDFPGDPVVKTQHL